MVISLLLVEPVAELQPRSMPPNVFILKVHGTNFLYDQAEKIKESYQSQPN